MISFNRIKWKNFLSTGSQFTEVQLNRSKSTLLVGSNGHGKSTIVDAITFALFNKPFRDINKGQLINSINKKDCVVEIEFTVGSISYRIVRGIKPNIFEIYVDGELLNQDAASKDQQNYLEENILRLNYKSFTQTSILGAANYTPFMQLPSGSRREVIEDLLDITVISKMNDVLKTRIKENQDQESTLKRNVEMQESKIESQQKVIETIEKMTNEKLINIENDIKENTLSIETYESKIKELENSIDIISKENIPIITELESKSTIIKDSLNGIKSNLDKILDEKSNFQSQDIENQEIKNLRNKVEELDNSQRELMDKRSSVGDNNHIDEDKILEIGDKIETCQEKIQRFKDAINEMNVRRKTSQEFIDFLSGNDNCPTCKQSITEDFKNRELEIKKNNIVKLDTNKEDALSRIQVIQDEINEHVKQKEKIVEDYKKKVRDEYDLLSIQIEDIRKNKALIKEEIESKLNELKEVRSEKVVAFDQVIKDLKENLKIENDKLEIILKEINDKNQDTMTKKQVVNGKIAENKGMLSSSRNLIEKLTIERDNLMKNTGDVDSEKSKLKDLEKSLVDLNTELDNNNISRKYLGLSQKILKDDGIKSLIIKQYIPVLNKVVNSYLQKQDLFVQFELDETFQEHIRSRHRDDFSYSSFSEGEKARIDISILLAFRSIARMKSTTCTDILVLDETFDSSIDGDGADMLSSILSTLEDAHVFVISHNEKMFDKFRSIIKFVKINNYSIIES